MLRHYCHLKWFIKASNSLLWVGILGSFAACQGDLTDAPAPSTKPNTENSIVCTKITITRTDRDGRVYTYEIPECKIHGLSVQHPPSYPTSMGTIVRDTWQGEGTNPEPPTETISSALELIPGRTPTEPGSYNCPVLRSSPETARLVGTFVMSNIGKSRSEILTQRGWYAPWYGDDKLVLLPKGPTERYVRDPLNTNVRIDLQRMLVMGNWGMHVANSEQIGLALTDADGYTGFNDRDFYSVHLGQDFYTNYASQILSNPENFAQLVSDFLNDPAQRTAYTDPGLCR